MLDSGWRVAQCMPCPGNNDDIGEDDDDLWWLMKIYYDSKFDSLVEGKTRGNQENSVEDLPNSGENYIFTIFSSWLNWKLEKGQKSQRGTVLLLNSNWKKGKWHYLSALGKVCALLPCSIYIATNIPDKTNYPFMFLRLYPFGWILLIKPSRLIIIIIKGIIVIKNYQTEPYSTKSNKGLSENWFG